jgi:hypothetical protein
MHIKLENYQFKTYKEALESEMEEIDLVEIFFWLKKDVIQIFLNMFWTDTKDDFVFYFFCKYGNIHFIDFTNGNLITETELENFGFIVNEDYDQFF